MSRHRGAKHRRRYELLGGISLLSPEYLLSVERWPFHSEPPDHYDLLSHLLELLLSQSSTLLPLHYQHDFRPYLAYLRTPPLPFRRRPPQSNCLPCTVPRQDHCPWLEPQTNQGGISRSAPRPLAWPLLCLPPILHKSVHSSMQSCSKGSWGLSVYKEFRYLRTVIVTAAVYWDFDQGLSPHQLIFQHRAGITPYTSSFDFAECCVFNKQSQPPIL